MSGQLQNGEQQFIDSNGKPLDSGTVDFYIPNTTTRKNTWQDQALTILNTNPVVLDAAGRAVIWGSGSYRQILKDKHGNLVWDKVVADPISSLSSNTGASFVGADDGVGGSIFTTVSGFITALKSSVGASLIVFIQSGIGAIARTLQSKNRDILDAADYIATPGASDALDKVGVQNAANEASSRSGAVVCVRSPIRTVWDLSSLSIPTNVIIEDDRYNSSGWKLWHSEGDDAQIGLRGRATLTGEGPSLLLHNLASTGNRNVTFTHWYGPSNAPIVASYEHWGFLADGNWYAGRQWLSKGSIDTGARARYRLGNDGGVIWNPNGDASSFKNNPATGFTQDYLFVFNAPLQSGYTYSGKNLFNIRANSVEAIVDVIIQGTNPALRFQNGAGSNRFGFIGDFPSSGQIVLYDYIIGANKQVWTSGGDTVHTGTFKSSSDNVDNLGSPANRFATVYAGTGTINTSDQNEKEQIQQIDAAVLRAITKIDFCQFKFKDAVAKKGIAARWHFGVIAQQVKAAFESEGVDPFAYGVLCFDDWPEEWVDHPAQYETSNVIGDDGKPVQNLVKDAWREKIRDAGSRWGVRYDELFALKLASLTQ